MQTRSLEMLLWGAYLMRWFVVMISGGWSAIAKLLPGRTPDMVKQRFTELLQG